MVLLLRRPVLLDHVRHDEVRVDHAGDRHPAARDLLDDERVRKQRLAQPAVLLGDRQAEQAHFLHALDDRLRELVLVLEFGRVRQDYLVHECLDRRDDLGLDVGETGGLSKSSHGGSIPEALPRRPNSRR